MNSLWKECRHKWIIITRGDLFNLTIVEICGNCLYAKIEHDEAINEQVRGMAKEDGMLPSGSGL